MPRMSAARVQMEENMGESGFHTFEFWEKLTDGQKRLLESRTREVEYQAGQIVRAAGSQCAGILLVKRGVFRMALCSGDGREATVSRMRAGEACVLTASCMISAISFDVQIQAETDGCLEMVPPEVFARLMEENIYVENFVYKSATERFSDVVNAVEQLLFMTLEQRLVTFLLDESAQQKSDLLHFTQEQIAVAIGSAREVVTRGLKKLAGEGAIELFRGGVRITDRKRLYDKV